MMEYDNTNRGAIWPNKDKTTDNHPDFKGKLNVDGIEYWVSAWKRKEGANPKSPSLSFAVQPVNRKAAYAPQESMGNEAAEPQKDFDDTIPF
jgi:hypothetical protein